MAKPTPARLMPIVPYARARPIEWPTAFAQPLLAGRRRLLRRGRVLYDCVVSGGATWAVDAVAPAAFAARFRELVVPQGEFQRVRTVKIRSDAELAVCERTFLLAGYAGAVLRHGREGYGGRRLFQLAEVRAFRVGRFPVVDCRRAADGRLVYDCLVGKTLFEAPAAVTAPEYQKGQAVVRYRWFTTLYGPKLPVLPVVVGFE